MVRKLGNEKVFLNYENLNFTVIASEVNEERVNGVRQSRATNIRAVTRRLPCRLLANCVRSGSSQ